MDVKPKYSNLGSIFPENRIYNVPAFQRSYSWETVNIEQYTSDITEIFNATKNATKKGEEITDHFLGGIVCVKVDKDNRFDEKSVFELVDGQQRLSTTVLLVARMIEHIKTLSLDDDNADLRCRRVKKYKGKFLEVIIEEDDEEVSLPRINLSRRDKDYYYNAVYKNDFSNPKLKSHELIHNAAKKIDLWLTELSSSKDSVQILQDMNILFNVLTKAFNILIIKMVDVADAYRLFQVINDRGRSLTSGDLLRAGSLGYVDTQGASDGILDELEVVWDNITNGGNKLTEDKLLAYYNHKVGKSCRKNTLYQSFNKEFFHDNDSVEDTVRDIGEKCKLFDNLSSGKWPYENSQLTSYQKNKLYNLVVKFKHTKCLPFLMVASDLPEKKFYELVFCLEKFFFIFRVALSKRMNAVTKLYNDNIKDMNDINKLSNYQTVRFTKKICDIISDNLTVAEIILYIESLSYEDENNRRALKFIITSLEENYNWVSSSDCKYKNLYSKTFSALEADYGLFSLEHIYPKNAKSSEENNDLEPVKHKIGNITLLYAQDNTSFSNDKFEEKKVEYDKSRLNITNGLSMLSEWDISEYEKRTDELNKHIVKLFSFGKLHHS